MRNSAKKIANRIFEIRAAPAATPLKPSAPAMSEMTRKMMAHFSMAWFLPAATFAYTSAVAPPGFRRPSGHDRDALGGAGDGGVEPAAAVLKEGIGFVEQHDVVPLRPLRLVDGERVAVGELVRLAARRKGDLVLAAFEELRQHGDLDRPAAALVLRYEVEAHEPALRGAQRLDRPGAAVEEALGLVVAQADELLARRRHRVAEAEDLAAAGVVEPPRAVEADEDLVGARHLGGVDLAAGEDAAFAMAPERQSAAVADRHRQPDDRVVARLAVDLGQHDVRLGVGEEAAALHRRQLRRVAEHEHRLAEG